MLEARAIHIFPSFSPGLSFAHSGRRLLLRRRKVVSHHGTSRPCLCPAGCGWSRRCLKLKTHERILKHGSRRRIRWPHPSSCLGHLAPRRPAQRARPMLVRRRSAPAAASRPPRWAPWPAQARELHQPQKLRQERKSLNSKSWLLSLCSQSSHVALLRWDLEVFWWRRCLALLPHGGKGAGCTTVWPDP